LHAASVAAQAFEQLSRSAQDRKTWQALPSQYCCSPQLPQVPPHPSPPHVRPLHWTVHSGWQVSSAAQ
jgi:hypothetical protein